MDAYPAESTLEAYIYLSKFTLRRAVMVTSVFRSFSRVMTEGVRLWMALEMSPESSMSKDGDASTSEVVVSMSDLRVSNDITSNLAVLYSQVSELISLVRSETSPAILEISSSI